MPRTFRVVVARAASPDDARDGQGGPDAVARSLRDAGFEVIFGPAAAGADGLAEAVLQEDADAVAVAVADGASRLVELTAALTTRGIEDVLVVGIDGDGAELVARIERGLGLDGDS